MFVCINRAVLLFLSLIGAACAFTPDNEPFTVVESVSTEALVLAGFPANAVIPLYYKKRFTITAPVAGKKEYRLDVYVNEKWVTGKISSSPTFTFDLDPTKLANGEPAMQVLITYASGSGSLSDRMGNELVAAEGAWKLLVDNVSPDAVDNAKAELINGRLRVSWRKPTKTNFQYNIIRLYTSANPIVRDTFKLQDNQVSEYYDETYVGGSVSYQVDLTGAAFVAKGTPAQFDCIPLTVRYEEGFPKSKFSFVQSPLYNHKIEMMWINPSVAPVTYQPANAGVHEVLQKDLTFGGTTAYTVYVRQPSPNNNQHSYRINLRAYMGYKTKPFQQIYFSSNTNNFYTSSSSTSPSVTKIYKLDGTSGNISDSLVIQGTYPNFITSEDASQSYLLDVSRTILKKIDLTTFTILQDIDIRNIIGSTEAFGTYVRVSNDNLISCFLKNEATINIIDLNTGTIIYNVKSTGNYLPVVSGDGQYFVLDQYFYRRSGAAFKYYARVSQSEYAIFTPDGKLMTCTRFPITLQIYDANATKDKSGNLPVSRTIPNLYLSGLGYDSYTNTFFGEANLNGVSLCLYDGDDFSLKSSLKLYSWNDTYFINGTVFHRNGFYIPKP